jgi:hypothetical protein
VVLLVYGRDGSSGRYVVGADARTGRVRYAFDLVNFARPPGGWLEEVEWAREADGVLSIGSSFQVLPSSSGGAGTGSTYDHAIVAQTIGP